VFRGTITGWQLHHLSITQDQVDNFIKDIDAECMLALAITGTV